MWRAEDSHQHPLSTLGFFYLQRSGLSKEFCMSETKLVGCAVRSALRAQLAT